MSPENLDSTGQKEEISLKEILLKTFALWRYILSKWVIIIVFGICGSIIGLTLALLKKPVYLAFSTFVLEEGDKGGGLGQYSGIASLAGIDIGNGGGIFEGDNIIELYKSRTMLAKTLLTKSVIGNKSELLIERFIKFNELRKKWDEKPYLKNLDFRDTSKFDVRQDSIINLICKDINKKYLNVYKPDKKLSIIRVEILAKDELFAKVFTENLVKNVNDFYVLTKTKKSLENILILEVQRDSVNRIMNRSINTAASIIDATPNLNPTRQALRAPIQKSQFNAETNKAILTELVKNLELAKISFRKEKPLIQVIDRPILPLESNKASKLLYIVIGFICLALFKTLQLLIKKALFN